MSKTSSNKQRVAERERERDRPKPSIDSDLVYGLRDKPPFPEALLAALQHVLAAFAGIIAPPLIIGNAIGLDTNTTSFLVSMSLFVAGIATFIQVKKIGPVGSGLLSIQGTSFSFLSPIIATGLAAIEGGRTPNEALGVIFGVCLVGSFVEIILSCFLHLVKKFVTPLVTGIVVSLIGLSLIEVAINSMAGGEAARESGTFASLQNLGLAGFVLLIVVVLNSSKNQYLRTGSIVIGLLCGYLISFFLGIVDFSSLSDLQLFNLPVPFRYGFGFSWSALIPIAFIYVITTIETIGDLTATSSIANEPISGRVYMKRLKGGVLGDGVNSLIAGVFNAFPNTTFSENNGIIQITGIGSRYIGIYIAAILVLLGLFPIVGGVISVVPEPVLGGATILMFGTVAAIGIKILLSADLNRRALTILALSLGLGLGVSFVPEVFDAMPELIKNIFGSGIATGGMTAIVLNIVLPEDD